MYCRKCGTQNDDNAWKCVNCGAELRQGSQEPQQPPIYIPNYLAFAILVTIFCCCIFGIPAIVFAAQVNGKVAAGDIEGAMKSSRMAKIWCWVAIGVGLVNWIICGIFWGIGFIFEFLKLMQ